MKKKLLSVLCLGGWMLMTSVSTKAELIQLDRVDVQAFERNYEAWVQELVKKILPESQINVIAEIQYTSNPDLLQSYEEKKAANHLPGLPEVSDLEVHPTQNPIFELIQRQKIKIILDRQPDSSTAGIIKELISSKILLDSDRGDAIRFESVSGSGIKTAGGLISTRSGRGALIVILLSGIIAIAVSYSRRRTRALNRRVAAEKLNVWYEKINPAAHLISTDQEVLSEFISRQDSSLLVDAMAHASDEFIQAVLKSFSGEGRIELFEIFEEDRLKVTSKKSRYAQLYLLAKIRDEQKINQLKKIDVMAHAVDQSRIQRERMNESLKELKSLYDQREVATGLEEGVEYEQSI